MLLLTRRENEIITIDGKIHFKVMYIRNKQVCIGIHAPLDKHIMRAELLTDIQKFSINSVMGSPIDANFNLTSRRNTVCKSK